MTDLTVLSSTLPIYPPSNATKSSIYKTFIPGASSSRFSVGPSVPDLPANSRREASDDTTSTSDHSEDGDGDRDTDDTDTSSLSSLEDLQVKTLPNDPTRGRSKSMRNGFAGYGGNGGRRSGSFGAQNDADDDEDYSKRTPTTLNTFIPPHSPPASSPAHVQCHNTLLPPPPPPRGRQKFQQHRPTRSRSAPPSISKHTEEGETTPTASYSPNASACASQMSFEQYSTYEAHRHPRRSRTALTFNSGLNTPSGIFVSSPSWARDYGVTMGGELLKPPPPLHRPTTFWRRTRRSGVTASTYSPSTHVIRRSTFVAAGLPFERPMADLSAMGVESRFRNAFEEKGSAKLNDVFWEVVMER